MKRRLSILAVVLASALLSAFWFHKYHTQGYLFSVRIVGNSMATAFLGQHRSLTCHECGFTFLVAPPAKQSNHSNANSVVCPNCVATLDLAKAKRRKADQVLIDKRTLRRRDPARWEVVACRNPDSSNQLVIKRIFGLPTERIYFSPTGAILVDNQSPIDDRQTVESLLIDVNDDRYRRGGKSHWQNVGESKWQQMEDGFGIQSLGSSPAETHWLKFIHQGSHSAEESNVIYDDHPFNLEIGRELHPAEHVFVTGRVAVAGDGVLYLRCTFGDNVRTWEYHAGSGEGYMSEFEVMRHRFRFRAVESRFQIFAKPGGIIFQMKATNGEAAVRGRCPDDSLLAGGEVQYSIGARNLKVMLRDLRVERSPSITADVPRPASATWYLLGADEYFLLGDNGPVSIDSRHWSRMVRRSDLVGLVKPR